MKLIETLTTQQKINLLNGAIVGIFPNLFNSTDAFYGKLYELCLGYYLQRSGMKTISVTYEQIIELVKNNTDITETSEDLMSKLIRGKFIEKWTKIYEALINSQYNPLNDFDETEERDYSTDDTTTFDNQTRREGGNSLEKKYESSIEDNGNTGTKTTTTINDENNYNNYGFNSTGAVPVNSDNGTNTETTEGKSADNTTHNKQDRTGTDTDTFEVDETSSKTGTDSRNIAMEGSTTKTGRKTDGASLIEKELNLRNTQIFFDIIYSDIDSIATLQIYI